MTGEANPKAPTLDDAERSRKIQQVTLVAMATNLCLSVLQVVIGVLGNAFSLVVDAVHTFSDLLTDGLVFLAARKGADPADDEHPYGHERFETVVSLFLGMVLVAVGAGFLWSAGARIQSADALPPLHPIALWMALFTLLAKEALFRFSLAASRRLSSRMLEANAWHARTDAASSLVVAIGIGGGLLGYRFIEPLAAALVGFMIVRMGLRLAYAAIRELVDTAVSKELVIKIQKTIEDTPGVIDGHELRTRRMAHRVLCDAHIQVDPRVTVSEGHYISERVRRRICEAHPQVHDVLVHVDPEDDLEVFELPRARVPDRATLVAHARQIVGDGLPAPDRVLVHYLGGRVEIELFYPLAALGDTQAGATLAERIREGLASRPEIRSLRVYGLAAQ
jgi:cation diffusion facilitator family transporter